MDSIEGKVALVTGASRGIGREIALALADAGADVAVGYRSGAEEAAAVVSEIEARGRKAIAIPADLSDPEQAAGLVTAATKALGTVAILVNNAGINPSKPLDQVTPADWDETIRVNLSSVFYVTQAVLPGMRERGWGRLIMLSSVAAQTGGVIGPHYSASKAGILGLVHSYASLLAKEGVTCNAIAPALIETDMLKGNDRIKPELIPLGRFGQPDEVSSIALLLAQNGYITGQTINANGGWYMN
ncbi:3-oxoacyl-ACP reductase family protein [Novosphingobium sp. BL-52-GroH]|uniref:3-oxoacyl-ACP reductase family protein n=1 Tax=Novosphingobium sp. BL-52-GroH TaxID=3349877 RepID=UPI00384D760F